MDKIVVVAQTPFQFFCAFLFSKYSKMPCDLWLIGKNLWPFYGKCKNSNVWESVFYIDCHPKIKANPKVKRVLRIIKTLYLQRKIKKYISSVLPTRIVIFSDNLELTVSFAYYGKEKANSEIILIEEGTTVYFSPFRVSASPLKSWIRKFFKLQNPFGYSIGWSPWIDKLVVSYPEKCHPDYLSGRSVVKWPSAPYPNEIIEDFVEFLDVKRFFPPAQDVDGIYLGQPLSEVGIFSEKEEFNFLKHIDSAGSKFSIWVKPHPFDPNSKYDNFLNLNLFDKNLNNIPAEVLCRYLKPKFLLSYFSSAAITFSVKDGGCSFFFIPDKNQKIFPFKSLLMEKFAQSKRLEVKSSFSEILDCIEGLKFNSEIIEVDKDDPQSWKTTIGKLTNPTN